MKSSELTDRELELCDLIRSLDREFVICEGVGLSYYCSEKGKDLLEQVLSMELDG